MISASGNQQDSPYQGLLYSIFQQPRTHADKGLVVAITAALPGEGVSHVSRNIGAELTRRTEGRILTLELDQVRQGSATQAQFFPVASTESSSIFHLRSGATGSSPGLTADNWQRSQEYRQECVSAWRSHFEYTLVDCPPLLVSQDALSVARLVDGFLVVIEANRTRKKQIEYVESQIETAGGTLLGYVLNKRKYLIPESIFRYL